MLTFAQRKPSLNCLGRHGFTLIELLITTAIIAILAALLFSAGKTLVMRGESAGCLANLRQLAAGCIAYSGDNDGRLVPMYNGTNTWRSFIAPYIGISVNKETKNPYQCPADPNRQLYAKGILSGNGYAPSSYGINFYWAPLLSSLRLHDYTTYAPGRRQSAIKCPSQMIFLCDLAKVANPSDPIEKWKVSGAAGNPGYARFPSDAGFYGGDSWDIYPRHGGTLANVVFYDGHASTIDVKKDILPNPPGTPGCLYDNNDP